MVNKADRLVTDILETIKRRYIIHDFKIPADVLKLKDETMKIFAEVHDKPNGSYPEEHDRRLAEINAMLGEGEMK